MRRLLIISHPFPPCPAPGTARVWRLYKYLPEFGYETHVLTAWQPDKPWPRVTYVPVPARNILERTLRKFVFTADDDIQWAIPGHRRAVEILKQTPMDAVLSTFPYVQQHMVGYQLKKEFGIPWIADYRDPLVGNPFRLTTGLPGLVDRRIGEKFFQNADLMLSVTDYVRRRWIRFHPELEAKSAVIWNGYDPEEVIEPRRIPEKPYRVVAHFGTFYSGRSPAVPMESMLRLIRRGAIDPARYRFRFTGTLDPAILAEHRELFEQLTSVGCLEMSPVIPRTQVLEQMMESDSLLLADNNRSDIGHTVPAKLFEYVRVGRPILALTVNGSPVDRILALSGVRYVVLSPDMDEAAIDNAMMEFLDLPTDPVELSQQFLNEFNGRNQARTLAGLIDRMLEGQPIAGDPAEEKLMNHAQAV